MTFLSRSMKGKLFSFHVIVLYIILNDHCQISIELISQAMVTATWTMVTLHNVFLCDFVLSNFSQPSNQPNKLRTL